jgi:hypothetical protein
MPADPSRIVTARQILAHLGLTPAARAAHPDPSRRMPTFAEYLPRVAAAASPGARRTYGTYWNRMAAALGHLRLDEVTASDIEALMRQVTATARSRRTGRKGRHAGEHVIAAARAAYRRAVADSYLTAAEPVPVQDVATSFGHGISPCGQVPLSGIPQSQVGRSGLPRRAARLPA